MRYRFIIYLLGCLLTVSSVYAADLSTTVAASPASPVVNENLTYNITIFPVRSGSTSAVNDVILTYGLPSTFTLVSAEVSQGSCDKGTIIRCRLGNLAATSVATVNIVVKPTTVGSISSVINVNGTTVNADGEIVITSNTIPVNSTVAKPPAITLGLNETAYTVNKNGRNLTVTVNIKRTDETPRAVAVNFATSDGSAKAGVNYTATQGTLNWAQGDINPKTFTIPIIDDRVVSDNQSFTVTLSDPQSATLEAGRDKAVVTITNTNVSGQIGFSPSNYTVNKNESTVTLTVVRGSGSDGRIVLDYATNDGTAQAGRDYLAASGTLTWEDKDTTPKTLTVSLVNENVIKGNLNFTVTLSTPTNRAQLGQATAIVTIVERLTVIDAVSALTAVARNPVQRAMAVTVGRLCQSGQASLDLQQRCTEMIVGARLNPSGVANALQQLAPEEYAVQGRLALEASARQVRNINSRLMALRAGAVGIDIDNITVDVKGQPIPNPSDPDFQLKGKPLPGQPGTGQLPSGKAHAFELDKLGLFLNGTFSFGDKGRTELESGFDFNLYNITAGIDYRFADTFILGAALGVNRSRAKLYENSGKSRINGLNLSIYATLYQSKAFYVDALYGYGWNDYKNDRNIIYTLGKSNVYQVMRSGHGGTQQSISVSSGYHFNFDKVTLTPTIRLDNVTHNIDGFEESPSNDKTAGSGLGLQINEQKVKSFTLAVGGQVSVELKQEFGTIIPLLSLEWVTESQNKQRSISGGFIGDGSREGFSLQTDFPDKSYGDLGLGIGLQLGKGKYAFLNYETLLGLKEFNNHSISAGLRLEF